MAKPKTKEPTTIKPLKLTPDQIETYVELQAVNGSIEATLQAAMRIAENRLKELQASQNAFLTECMKEHPEFNGKSVAIAEHRGAPHFVEVVQRSEGEVAQ